MANPHLLVLECVQAKHNRSFLVVTDNDYCHRCMRLQMLVVIPFYKKMEFKCFDFCVQFANLHQVLAQSLNGLSL